MNKKGLVILFTLLAASLIFFGAGFATATSTVQIFNESFTLDSNSTDYTSEQFKFPPNTESASVNYNFDSENFDMELHAEMNNGDRMIISQFEGTGTSGTWNFEDGTFFNIDSVYNSDEVNYYYIMVSNNDTSNQLTGYLLANSEVAQEYNVTYNVTDDTGFAVDNATVEIDGQTLTTNSTGQAVLTLTEGTYDYTISKAGHDTISDMVNVNIDTTVDSVLNRSEYDINVTVLDESQEALSNATVTFQGQEYQTSSDGNLTLVGTYNESYNITVDKDTYVSSTQSITIEDSPTTLSYTLDYERGDIEGNVTDDSGNPIENTSVTLDTGETTKTDSTGFYRFDNLRVGGYALSVDADGYNSTSQSVTVQNDTVTTNDVTLQSDSTTDDGTSNDGSTNDSTTDGDEDGTTDDGSTDDSTTDGDEDSTTSDGAIGVEIVLDEYRIVENQEVNLTAELSGATADEVSFEWFVSGESFGGDTQSIEYFFDDDGDYQVSVRVTEDATGDIVEGTLSLNEEDWTEDGELIFTDLIVKTYDADGNPVNASFVNVNYIGSKVGHTTEFQVVADRNYTISAEDYIDDGFSKITSRKFNVSVAAGETKTVELTLIEYGGFASYDDYPHSFGDSYIWVYGLRILDGEILPPDSGSSGSSGSVGTGISATILLSILVAAGLVIILGGFWLFNLLAAVVGGEQGINGIGRIGRIIRRKDD